MPLFYDPQDAPVIGCCRLCGGEIYGGCPCADDFAESGLCWFCREEIDI